MSKNKQRFCWRCNTEIDWNGFHNKNKNYNENPPNFSEWIIAIRKFNKLRELWNNEHLEFLCCGCNREYELCKTYGFDLDISCMKHD